MDLKDKVVIVTGAGSGVGRALALEFAARAAAELSTLADPPAGGIRVACPELSGKSFEPDTDFDKVLRDAKRGNPGS